MELCSKEAFRLKEQLRNLRKPLSLCLCGLFVALYVVLSFFNIRMTEVLEFRFAFLALVAAAAYGGPIMGMCTGIAGDVVSFLMTPQSGAFFPGFTLTYGIMGFCFGILLYHTKITVLRAILVSLVDYILAITLSTFWLHLMYGMEWKYLLTIRLIKCTISFGVNAVLIFIFMKAFQKVISTVFASHQSQT